MYVMTSFMTTRIIYGVEASFSTGRPYHAHRRAAVNGSLIINHSGLWPAEQCCLLLRPLKVFRSLPSGRSWRLCLAAFLAARMGSSSESHLFNCQTRLQSLFAPHPLLETFFNFERIKSEKTFQFFQNSFFAVVYCFLRDTIFCGILTFSHWIVLQI